MSGAFDKSTYGVTIMAVCVVCGNEYDAAFTLTLRDGTQYVFDSFECAIDKVAPRCGECGCRIVGHGIQSGRTLFCCAHCARTGGSVTASDRA